MFSRITPIFLILMFTYIPIKATITIDDFSDGSLDVTLGNFSIFEIQTGLSNVVGGRRSINVTPIYPVSDDTPIRTILDTSSGIFGINAEGQQIMESYSISYGLRDLSFGSADEALNLDLTGLDAFKLSIVESSQQYPVNIYIRSGVNENTMQSVTISRNFPFSPTVAHSVRIPFSSFEDRVDVSDIDYISIGAEPSVLLQQFGFVLDNISVVPKHKALLTDRLFTITGSGPNALYQTFPNSVNAEFQDFVPTTANILYLKQGPTLTTAYAYSASSDNIYLLDLLKVSVISTTKVNDDMLNNGRGFAVSPEGVLYGIFGRTNFKTIDPETGVTTFIAKISGLGDREEAGTEAMTFGPDGTLYVAASPRNRWGENLYTMDVETGELSLIGQIGDSFIDIDNMAFGPDGYLYGADTMPGPNPIWRIDTLTGDREIFAILPTGTKGAYFPIPEPASIVLMVLGLILLFNRQWNRDLS